MRSANPALKRFAVHGTGMTLDGAVNKTIFGVLLTILSTAFSWMTIVQSPAIGAGFIVIGAIIGLVIALVTIFKQSWAPYTTPAYAVVEGMVLGGLSATFEAAFPGIVLQAVLITFGILLCMLGLYKSRIIKVTNNFRLAVFAATGGIFLVYLATMILGFFGMGIPFIHEGGMIGILFSLFVVGVASMNLVVDFDYIERHVRGPKYMEWYAAFTLLVTLIWLYIEILDLLAKVRSD